MAKVKNGKNFCTLYLVRHGETEWNITHTIMGHTDSPLTQTGINQAKDTAQKLKKINFAAVFSSDLLRARRTAEIIAAEKKLAVETTEALRERTFGRYEGQVYEKYQKKFARLIKKYQKMSDEDRFTFRTTPEVESDQELMDRVIRFLRQTAVAYQGKNVLLVTHGGVLRVLLIRLGFAGYDQLPAYAVDNGAYARIQCDGVDFFVKETYKVNQAKPTAKAEPY